MTLKVNVGDFRGFLKKNCFNYFKMLNVMYSCDGKDEFSAY